MRWARKARTRLAISGSLWVLSLPGFVLGIITAAGLMRLDRRYQWVAMGLGSSGAQAFLASIVGTLISFVGITFSVTVLMVQLASAQLTPRVVRPLMRAPFAKVVLSVAMFTLGYSFTLLLRLGDGPVPQLAVAGSVLLAVLTVMGFVTLLERVGHGVRFATIITGLANLGVRAARRCYPWDLGAVPEDRAPSAGSSSAVRETIVPYRGRAGVVQAYDISSLEELARRRAVSVVALRAVGEYVYPGAALYRLEGAAELDDLEWLQEGVLVGLDRVVNWDPAFAVRMLVDIGIRALSPAINDPGTAVHTIGGIEQLLADLGARDLTRPPHAADRVRIPGPTWEGLVDLACTELRMFGGGSVAVLRRLHAMLDALSQSLPEARRPALRRQLDLVERAAEQTCHQPEERTLARQGDSLGLG